TTQAADKTVLDIYEVTYAGLAAPLRLYLDEYHWETPRAPVGLVCGIGIPLTPPAPAPTAVSSSATPATPASTVTEDSPGLSSSTSRCPVAGDDAYAVSAANAIRLG